MIMLATEQQMKKIARIASCPPWHPPPLLGNEMKIGDSDSKSSKLPLVMM
jgi:hypothetical protein